MANLKDVLCHEKAQGLVEYILIVALIALVAIGAVRMFGGKIAKWFEKSATTMDEEINTDTSTNP